MIDKAIRAFALCLLTMAAGAAAQARNETRWIGSWGAPPSDAAGVVPAGVEYPVADATFRTVIRLSAGGNAARFRLSNELGQEPLRLDSVRVAIWRDDAIVPGSERRVTFAGDNVALIGAGAAMVSDPVNLPTDGLAKIVVSFHVTGPVMRLTSHLLGQDTTWIASGDQTASPVLSGALPVFTRFVLSGVEVASSDPQAATIVALGDSITDGAQSTFGMSRRWPDRLAERLQRASGRAIGVVNQGISSNRLLRGGGGIAALARLDRDVFAQPNVRTLMVLEGINDIGMGIAEGTPLPSAEDLIAAYRQIADRAHARGIRVIGGTLIPFGGSDPSYFSAEGDRVRQKVNAWIRTTKAFDAVVDFDRALADPANPSRMLPRYDSGDHIHPSDEGYATIAEAIDLTLLR